MSSMQCTETSGAKVNPKQAVLPSEVLSYVLVSAALVVPASRGQWSASDCQFATACVQRCQASQEPHTSCRPWTHLALPNQQAGCRRTACTRQIVIACMMTPCPVALEHVHEVLGRCRRARQPWQVVLVDRFDYVAGMQEDNRWPVSR
jgi:hypothetical protein